MADADPHETDPRPPGAAFDAWYCPDCGHGLIGTEADPFLLWCERCDKRFAVPTEDREQLIAERPVGGDEELDGLRIRQFAAGRRAAYRARSYAVIATTVCVVAAGQLAWYALDHTRHVGLDVWPFAYGLGALLALLGGVFFARKTLDLHRETRRPPPKPPEADPDFSILSDGSQHWRNLEEMR